MNFYFKIPLLSNQSRFETSNLGKATLMMMMMISKSGSNDDHLSSLNDLIATSLMATRTLILALAKEHT
jgi:hypothetical protein